MSEIKYEKLFFNKTKYLMPEKEGLYLVVMREYDIFSGKYNKPKYSLLEWNCEHKAWNTKADIKVLAWADLPDIENILQ